MGAYMGGQPPQEKNIDIKAQFVDKREPRLEASIKWNAYSVTVSNIIG